jgi:hypothetical protein
MRSPLNRIAPLLPRRGADDGRLAGPVRADQAHDLARRHAERDLM